MWISPLQINVAEPEIKDRITERLVKKECGLITDIRLRRGPKVAKRNAKNFFAIVEFADENSYQRVM